MAGRGPGRSGRGDPDPELEELRQKEREEQLAVSSWPVRAGPGRAGQGRLIGVLAPLRRLRDVPGPRVVRLLGMAWAVA